MATLSLVFLIMAACFLAQSSVSVTLFSSRLIHRFSDEVKALGVSRKDGFGMWPERKSLEYYQVLVSSDLQRQNMKLGPKYQLLFPSEGSKTMSFGNDFGWLHYTWIDIGTPNVPFLVALDAGSDLLWLPCDCIQCAPLSASYYNSLSIKHARTAECGSQNSLSISSVSTAGSIAVKNGHQRSWCSLVCGASIMQDRDLNEYSPSGSSTSKDLSCSHQLCESSPNCKSPKQLCPYTVNYYSENTSSSGMLVEDTFHLASGTEDASKTVHAPVIIGCGRKQSGGYLDGVAPDGLMGLGFGEISVPSFLAKAGLVPNSFSMCFDDDDAGRIFFGDKGPASQQSTPFLPSDGKYTTYIIGVNACCIGSSCIARTSFKALVDSGTSFTFLPEEVYKIVVQEFDSRVTAKSTSYEGSPWKYCYESSTQESPKIPSLKFMFPSNNSFVIHNPVFLVYGNKGVVGFCLAVQPTDGDVGIIGQNFMTGYRMVFDRESLKLGWSRSDCQDLSDKKKMPLTPPPDSRPANPLPTNEQQSTPSGHAVAPAVAGRAPSKPSTASPRLILSGSCFMRLLPLLLLLCYGLPS